MSGQIHYVTCWKWDAKKRQGKFWIDEDCLNLGDDQLGQKQPTWDVEFVRTDHWSLPQERRPFGMNVHWKIGRRWTDVFNKNEAGSLHEREFDNIG